MAMASSAAPAWRIRGAWARSPLPVPNFLRPQPLPTARTSASAIQASSAMVPSMPPVHVPSASPAPFVEEATPISLWCVQPTPPRLQVQLTSVNATVPLATMVPTALPVLYVHPTTTAPVATCQCVQPTALLPRALLCRRLVSAMQASTLQMVSLLWEAVLSVLPIATVAPLASPIPSVWCMESQRPCRPPAQTIASATGATLEPTIQIVWLVWQDSGAGTANPMYAL